MKTALRAARERLDISLKEAGQSVGVDYLTVAKWEDGQWHREGTRGMVEELCRRYMELAAAKGLDAESFHPDVLLRGAGSEQPETNELPAVPPEILAFYMMAVNKFTEKLRRLTAGLGVPGPVLTLAAVLELVRGEGIENVLDLGTLSNDRLLTERTLDMQRRVHAGDPGGMALVSKCGPLLCALLAGFATAEFELKTKSLCDCPACQAERKAKEAQA